jgi:anti-sigma regulatory factor (Ser/Thr protein kinase)
LVGIDVASVASFGCVVGRNFVSGVTTVAVTGRLAGGNAAVARFALRRCLADQPLAVVVDLNGVAPTQDVTCAGLFGDRGCGAPGAPALVACADPDTVIGWVVRARHGHQVPVFNTRIQALAAAAASRPAGRRHLYLRPDCAAAGAARRLVVEACRTWGVAHLAEQAELIATELVTNAVVHAGTELDLTVALGSGWLRLAVRDRSRRRPRLRRQVDGGADALAIRGRGLWLVEALAGACGVVTHPDGKTVWATLRAGSTDLRGAQR